ncbi:MAG: AbrB/MazE/SpoVT family DNA-binding domain-containing protein [Lachnospiraceae bacterium]|jgi:transcriptional pleiotropic regulator of transition state genes|nr:AbrB/MazE/SpoVT family DNA-binding domain-containing protein [Lachnospiraceae bacterium]
MKSTGIVRRLDDLGRITLPSELRKTMGVTDRDQLEIYVEGDKVVLEKYEPSCVFLGIKDELKEYHGYKVSKQAAEELARLFGLIE